MVTNNDRAIENAVGLSFPAIHVGGLPALDLHQRCLCALDSGGNIINNSIWMDDPFRVRSAWRGCISFILISHLSTLHWPTCTLRYLLRCWQSLAQGCPTVALWSGTPSNWYPVSMRQIELLERIVPVARTYRTGGQNLSGIDQNGFRCPIDKAFGTADQRIFQELFGCVELDSTGQIALIVEELVRKSNHSVFGVIQVVKNSIKRLLIK